MKLAIISPAYLNKWEIHVALTPGLSDTVRAEYQRILQQQADLAGFTKVDMGKVALPQYKTLALAAKA